MLIHCSIVSRGCTYRNDNMDFGLRSGMYAKHNPSYVLWLDGAMTAKQFASRSVDSNLIGLFGLMCLSNGTFLTEKSHNIVDFMVSVRS